MTDVAVLLLNSRSEVWTQQSEYLSPSVVAFFSLPTTTQRIKAELSDVINFEVELAKLPRTHILQDPSYDLYSFPELEQEMQNFEWQRFFESFMDNDAAEFNITDEYIYVTEIEYVKQLFVLLGNTPKITIANYIGWRTIQDHVLDLGVNFEALHKRYLRESQLPNIPPRSKRCIDVTVNIFNYFLTRLYLDERFDEKNRLLADELFDSVRNAILQRIHELEWLQPGERQQLKQAMQKCNQTNWL